MKPDMLYIVQLHFFSLVPTISTSHPTSVDFYTLPALNLRVSHILFPKDEDLVRRGLAAVEGPTSSVIHPASSAVLPAAGLKVGRGAALPLMVPL